MLIKIIKIFKNFKLLHGDLFMDERVENPELKEIMKTSPEEMTEEQLESFVDAFMEEIALDEEIDIDIMKLEDEEGNVLFPIYTDDDEIEKLAEEEDFDIFGLVISAEDVAQLLYENEGDEFDGVVINPFHENAVELPLEAIFELFDVEECDDPNCNDPNHHH